jgi:hypothetical protein
MRVCQDEILRTSLKETVDHPDGGAQVVRDRVGERLQLPVGLLQAIGALPQLRLPNS